MAGRARRLQEIEQVQILLACEVYHPSVGGVQEVMRQIAVRLVERGHQVTVATSHLPERRSKDINGVKIAEFKVAGNLARGMSGEVDAYREYVLKGEYDLFMVKAAQQWTFDALIPVLDRMTRPKIFVPCGFSGLYEPSFADYYRRMPELLRKFDHLIFYASDYRDINLARDHGSTHLTVLPNGASERDFLVPRDPGAFSAWGMLVTDVHQDRSLTRITPLDAAEPAAVEALFRDLEQQGIEALRRENFPRERRIILF